MPLVSIYIPTLLIISQHRLMVSRNLEPSDMPKMGEKRGRIRERERERERKRERAMIATKIA